MYYERTSVVLLVLFFDLFFKKKKKKIILHTEQQNCFNCKINNGLVMDSTVIDGSEIMCYYHRQIKKKPEKMIKHHYPGYVDSGLII